jgi:hypothetical protein
VVAGALARKNYTANWQIAAVILLALNTLFYLSRVGLAVPYFPILHIAALASIFMFREKNK